MVAGSRLRAARGLIFYLPMTILVIQNICNYSNQLNVAQSLPYDEAPSPPSRTHVLPLKLLTGRADRIACPPDQIKIRDRVNPDVQSSASQQSIPRIVHQTSKTRCLTKPFAKATVQWQFDNWSYYFHDDEAMMRLFRQEFADFPHLELVASQCLLHGTLKADLWRYLVLWVYGGVYADLDAVPKKLTPQMLEEAIDGYFVVENWHMLSQYFMAVSPRHPIMWYAIQHALINLLSAADTGALSASMVTGPNTLHQAFMSFRADIGAKVDKSGVGFKPVWAGQFAGAQQRSITVVGVAENQNEYVHRDVIGTAKRNEYRQMDMTHFQDDKKQPTGRSCLSSILDSYDNDAKTFHG